MHKRMQYSTGDLFALPVATSTAPLPASAVAGMEQVESNTNPDWREAALAALKRVAERRATFTTDNVWAELESCEIPVHNNSALGPIMLTGSRRGWYADTMTVQPSVRDSRHGNRLRVWRSNLYKEQSQ